MASHKTNRLFKNYGILSVAAIAAAMSLQAAHAGTFTWDVDAGGGWDVSGNWTGAPTDLAEDVINITYPITAARTISLNGDRTMGVLNIGFIPSDPGADPPETSFAFTLNAGSPGASKLIFNNSGNGAQINMVATSNNNTISVPISIEDTKLTIANNANRTLTLSGNISFAEGYFGSLTFSGTGIATLADGATTISGSLTTIDGVIGGSVTEIRLNGTSALRLNNAYPDFTGNIYVESGILQIDRGSGSTFTNATLGTIFMGKAGTGNNSTLFLSNNGNAKLYNPMVIEGTGTAIIHVTGTHDYAGNISIGTGSTLKINSGGTGITISGQVSGGGGFSTNRALTFTNPNNTFSGGITITGATLQFYDNGLGTGRLNISNGITMYVRDGNNQERSGYIPAMTATNGSYSNGILLNIGNGQTLTIGDHTDSDSMVKIGNFGTASGGVMAVETSAKLVKVGTGTWTLRNTYSNYTGSTTIKEGTLRLFTTGVIAPSSAIIVGNGAFFDLVNVATYDVATGHTLAGGGSVLAVSGSTGRTIRVSGHLAPGDWEFIDGIDILDPGAIGALTIDRAANVNFLSGSNFDLDFTPCKLNDSLVLADSTGGAVTPSSTSTQRPCSTSTPSAASRTTLTTSSSELPPLTSPVLASTKTSPTSVPSSSTFSSTVNPSPSTPTISSSASRTATSP